MFLKDLLDEICIFMGVDVWKEIRDKAYAFVDDSLTNTFLRKVIIKIFET